MPNEWFVVIACAQCDGGYQVAEIFDGDNEDAIARNHGGSIIWRGGDKQEANKIAAEYNQQW